MPPSFIQLPLLTSEDISTTTQQFSGKKNPGCLCTLFTCIKTKLCFQVAKYVSEIYNVFVFGSNIKKTKKPNKRMAFQCHLDMLTLTYCTYYVMTHVEHVLMKATMPKH